MFLYFVDRISPVDVCWSSKSGFACISTSIFVIIGCCWVCLASLTSAEPAARLALCFPALLKKLPSLSLSISSPKSEP